MASRTLTVITDDLDGTELTDGTGTTLTFSIGTVRYEIDLSTKNRDKFTKAMKPYTDAARVVQPSRSAGAGKAGRSSSAKTPAADPAAVRAWAADNGIEVSARGRVPAAVLAQYQAAR